MVKRMSFDSMQALLFLERYPNKWHTYANDAKTLRAIAGLYFYRGLGVRGFEVNRDTHSMKLNKKVFEGGK